MAQSVDRFWELVHYVRGIISRMKGMANFDVAYELVRQVEGGYQRYSTDPGNYNSLGHLVGTNWGISAPVYERFLGRPPSENDMRAMSPAIAKEIYRTRFWDTIKGDNIRSQRVANIFFDGHVNHGRSGIIMMQRVLKVAADGVVGPITINALNTQNEAKVINGYIAARESLYHNLASQGMAMFLTGWLRRLDQFRTSSSGGLGLIVIGLIIYFVKNQQS